MSLFTMFRIFQINKQIIIPLNHKIQAKNYAAKPARAIKKPDAKRLNKEYQKELPVEKDVDKLLKYCCGTNLLKDGQDVELKPDSEYPDWLWDIHTEQSPRLDELDPNSKQYWRRLRKIGIKKLVLSKQLQYLKKRK